MSETIDVKKRTGLVEPSVYQLATASGVAPALRKLRRGYRLEDVDVLKGDLSPYVGERGDEVFVFDATGLTEVDSERLFELLYGFLSIRDWGETTLDDWKSPYFIYWWASSWQELALQQEIRLRWRDRLAGAFDSALLITQHGPVPLSDPNRSYPTLFSVLREQILLTYHRLSEASDRDAKALGRLTRDLAKKRWLKPLGYATMEELDALGITGRPEKGRPKLWASLPAYAADLGERLRRSHAKALRF